MTCESVGLRVMSITAVEKHAVVAAATADSALVALVSAMKMPTPGHS